MASAAAGIARLMDGYRAGDAACAGRLVDALYPELRRMAERRLQGERAEHSWQPTLLVHELYLELVRRKALGGEGGGDEEERRAFLGLAGFLMKRLLILHSRPLAQRVERLELDGAELAAGGADVESLQRVEELLAGLAEIDPRLRTVVEMRVFEGRGHEEIAAALGCSARTVGTWWSFARRWLSEQLGG